MVREAGDRRPLAGGGLAARCLLPAACCLLLAACRPVAPVLKIGMVAPFEGRHRAVGYDVLYSARLATRQINDLGGINGYRVELVALDDGGDPVLARQAAASLLVDPAVVVVIGHWLPETTATASDVYRRGDMPLIGTDDSDLAPVAPAQLPPDFQSAYEAVTPFDEVPGSYAAPAYDAMRLAATAIRQVTGTGRHPTRANLIAALENLSVQGITGETIGNDQ